MTLSSLLHDIERADVRAAAKAGEQRHNPLVEGAGRLAKGADQPPMFTMATAVLGAGLALGRRDVAEAGGRMLMALGVATAVKAALKASVVRTRPNVLWDEGRYETGVWGPNESAWNSFPSGHTANAVSVARAVGRVAPGWRPALWAAAAVAGGVQVPRGAHHPLDVAAGALVGLGAEAVANWAWPLAAPVLDAVLEARR
ncbi:MAG TPA: phosphatase PAP2 family protein [Rubellimicrobium sp.]|jgi:membrane-associated phospholipid phosphatase|nr:phosphatase PAP2 family protein [Rubellimicrobium sp.]